MSQKIKIEIKKDECIGAGTCEQIAGTVFKLGDDGRVHLLQGPYLEEYQDVTLEKLLEAAKSCPTSAISIVDEETKQVIYPK